MIITRTPFRISFAGGGSDLKSFYKKNRYGFVISAAIQKYMYIVIHPYFHNKIRLKYSVTEDVNDVSQINHPIIRECLKKVKIENGIEIASFADIPSGSGLGSSSSFTVGLLNALYAYNGSQVSKKKLAKEACEIEIDILGAPIGKQDQYAAAFGDLNSIRFFRDETVEINPLSLSESRTRKLENKICLYFTGGKRNANNILFEQRSNMADEKIFSNMKKLVKLAEISKDTFIKGDLTDIGRVLHDGWELKKSFAKSITNDKINKLYNLFIKNGAIGGKLLGAGEEGFLLIYADDHDKFNEAYGTSSFPLKIDKQGTKIIFNE